MMRRRHEFNFFQIISLTTFTINEEGEIQVSYDEFIS